MIRRSFPLLALLLLAAKSGQQNVTRIDELHPTGYDEFLLIGWNDACSAAFQYYSYPPVGTGLQGLPDAWIIGALTIAPEKLDPHAQWAYASAADMEWNVQTGKTTVDKLSREGYNRRGFPEMVREAPVSPRPGLADVILTTASLRISSKTAWPPARFKLRQVHYSPLVDCALLVFRDPSRPRDSLQFKLVRLLDPTVRHARAKAHLNNGLLFYNNADIYSGLEELSIAAAMDPGYALARYHHALLLAAHGRYDETLKELDATFRLEPGYKKEARKALELRGLRKDKRFKALLK